MQKSTSTSHNQAGFTLVEISIVIVVIGLIVAGVVQGQTLIENARIKSTISEVEDYKAAYVIFKDKYRAHPGDFSLALSLGAPFVQPQTGAGDGDGRIEANTAQTASATPANANECHLAWQHLHLDKLITKEYVVGDANRTEANVLPESTIPSTTMGGGYCFDFDATIGNHVLMGAADGAGVNDAPLLTPIQALQIDKKIDDSLANNGSVQPLSGQANCIAAPDYNTSNEDIDCSLTFRL